MRMGERKEKRDYHHTMHLRWIDKLRTRSADSTVGWGYMQFRYIPVTLLLLIMELGMSAGITGRPAEYRMQGTRLG